MSEYQYYEFQAVDRPLTEREMAELRALSSRAAITPTRLVNVYNWGNFRGNPAVLMEQYFDAFVYVANWGTHELMLRLPRRLLDPQTAARYCAGEGARARVAGDAMILEFRSEDEQGDWDADGEGWMPALLPLRSDLAGGDLRPLYLGWLLDVQSGMCDDDYGEPPVPPGLDSLSASLQALADFLRIDGDLLAVATERSDRLPAAQPSRRAIESWLASLAGREKDEVLLRLMEGEAHLRSELLRQYRQATAPAQDGADDGGGRTVGQLLAAAEQRAEARQRAEAERAAQERARREREQAAARARHLDRLAEREGEAWQQVDTLIATKRPADYDRAVELLVDLRDIHARSERSAAFEARLAGLREQHARKPSLLQQLDQAGVGVGPA